MKKKSRERLWLFNERKQRQTFIKDYGNPDFVKAVEESSNKNTSNIAPTVRRNGKNKRKKKKN